MREYFDKEKAVNYLKKFDKLKYFSNDILKYIKICEYDPNEYIYFSGDKLQSVKFLVKGSILVTNYNEAGDETIVCLVKAFNTLGSLELPLALETVANNLLAKSKCTLLSVSRKLIQNELDHNSLLYKMIAEELALGLKKNDQIAYMASRPLEERYLKLIEKYSHDQEIMAHLTQNELAKLLRVSDRQLRRVIKKIAEEKVEK